MLTSVHMKIHVLCDIMLSWVYSFQNLKWTWGLQLQGKAVQEEGLLGLLEPWRQNQ